MDAPLRDVIAEGAPQRLMEEVRCRVVGADRSPPRAIDDHVAQRGSLVADERLRFDFSHSKAMTPDELSAVEREVNAFIRQNTAVETRVMAPDDAQGLGARALFGEKYGDEVRVVSMGTLSGSGIGAQGDTYSLELCGGTHVKRTGDIGLFRIAGESASASGVRRVEALTGAAALMQAAAEAEMLQTAAGHLKSKPEDVPDRVAGLLEERRKLTAEITELKKKIALGGGGAEGAAVKDIAGRKFLGQVLQGVSGKDLRGLIDAQKGRLGSGIVLLIADTDGKAAVAAGVTDDLTAELSAVDIVRAAAEVLGGKGGGGRPDMAQAGGADASRAADAIAAAEAIVAGAT